MSQSSNPKTDVTKLRASLPVGVADQKLLIIGQKISTGSAIEKKLYTDITREDIDDKFVLDSALGVALSAIFDVFDEAPSPNLPRVDVIPLEDAGGAAKASATVDFSGTANKAGTIEFDIMGKSLELDIAVDDTPTGDIPAAFKAAVDLLELPLTTTNNGDGSVTLQAKNGGTIFNKSTIKIDGLAKDGSDYKLGTLVVALTGFTGGSGTPTLTNLLDIVSKVRYQTMTYPYEYGADLATDFLDPRFNVSNDILDGVAILKNTDSKADLITALDLLNSQCLTVLNNKEVNEDMFKGGEDLELDFVASARVAAIRALRLCEGANIVNLTPASVNGDLDSKGGMHIASLPYFNTPVPGAPLQPEGRGWTSTEIANLKASGGSVMGNNRAGNAVILDEIVTTYKTDAAGNDDATWKNLETVDTMSVCAEYIFNNLRASFPQSRLTAGDIVRGYSMVNDKVFISKMNQLFLALGSKALVPRSNAASIFFTENMAVTLDMVLGKITSANELPIVTQLRQMIINLRTNFSNSI
jgi:phage tail sheath gpL-like